MNIKQNKAVEKQKSDWHDDYEWEVKQKRLEFYIRQRPLLRPRTKIVTVIGWILLYLFLSFFMAVTVIYAFQITSYKWLIFFISYIVFCFLFLKKICIKSIECYQHYAKEETRRRCVCVPSCSEYSIAVLKKYNIFKALNKIRIRLFKTCGGYGYVHDEP